MSQSRRLGKSLDYPRPLKGVGGTQMIGSGGKNAHNNNMNYEINQIDDMITLIENVATGLANGSCDMMNLNVMSDNLRIHGPRLEEIAKDTLDRNFVTLRNSSQDERLSLMTRLKLLELIELRAKKWQVSSDINTYYHQSKVVGKNEDGLVNQMELLSTSPPSLQIGSATGVNPALGPGELIRNSGKFSKPTKIPGKNYSKDEIVIRNADSGKVNPGAKERLVQITGPSEEKINYAKSLIEDTIRRNASPVRLDSQMVNDTGMIDPTMSVGNGMLMTNQQQSNVPIFVPNNNNNNNQLVMNSTPKYRNNFVPGGLQQSYSTDDASLGEYKYTVNVGQHSIKITGDNFELIRTAKLVLDDYFSGAEFVQPLETTSTTTPTMELDYQTVASQYPMMMAGQQNVIRDDSGIALDKKSPVNPEKINEVDETGYDDEVFIVDENGQEIPVSNANHIKGQSGVARSKKSNNLIRYSNSPSSDDVSVSTITKPKDGDNGTRICYDINQLLEYSNTDCAWTLPHNWIEICGKWPALVRNKVGDSASNMTEVNNNNNKQNFNYKPRPSFTRHKSFDSFNTNYNNRYRKSFTPANPPSSTSPSSSYTLDDARKPSGSVSNRLQTFTRSTSLCD